LEKEALKSVRKFFPAPYLVRLNGAAFSVCIRVYFHDIVRHGVLRADVVAIVGRHEFHTNFFLQAAEHLRELFFQHPGRDSEFRYNLHRQFLVLSGELPGLSYFRRSVSATMPPGQAE